ncbi:Creatinase/Aminopeptidase P/Spt16 N-terminal protein [Dioscorea alata]|uniref:Creatinase/Aminopeptidase P/Spt16 N-terminal protein n=2 Tax=Dioscorea alata TaxID=55571 RepID=A0ACB7WKA3_DIOAL|nr:Creatinase/Aminopeptidase P/Spt16 N-terminal protein [Dioscorea alata]KAH7688349.1 Creatinase/Aminopeptidase P/Spt16 N-terminal protein [Dioscorea alata]
MAKKGRKKAAPKLPSRPEDAAADADKRFKEQQLAFSDQEVERRIAAIQAIQAAEVESLLSRLRLLRSYLSKEQLDTCALTFFQKNLPNLSVVKNEKYKVYELEYNNKSNDLLGNHGHALNIHVSTDNICQPSSDLYLSAKSVKNSFLDAANYCIPDFVFDEQTENLIAGMRDAFQTPGNTSNRLSFGMTPKTQRVPKHGEMLLSVHGSPLGVYREDNLEAIHESGDCPPGDGAC